jgi:hypothetical protein
MWWPLLLLGLSTGALADAELDALMELEADPAPQEVSAEAAAVSTTPEELPALEDPIAELGDESELPALTETEVDSAADESMAIRKLEQILPHSEITRETPPEEVRPHLPQITLQQIKASGTKLVAVREGTEITKLSDGSKYFLNKLSYFRVYNLQDHLGYNYILNSKGDDQYLVEGQQAEPIDEVTNLYRAPHQYTPAPKNIWRAEYDSRLTILPEARLSLGLARGDFMRDLFEDTQAVSGLSSHVAASLFTQWQLPVRVGAGINYEASKYQLSSGGAVHYSALSAGPIFRSKDFDLHWPVRFQAQFRVTPFSQLEAHTVTGTHQLKFNAAELYLAAETPIKNWLGEYVMGAYFMAQWLNLRNQSVPVNLNPSNESNKSWGFTISQVFQ